MAGKSRKEQLEEMLAEDPGDPFLHYGLAMEHASAGDDRAAVGALSAAPCRCGRLRAGLRHGGPGPGGA